MGDLDTGRAATEPGATDARRAFNTRAVTLAAAVLQLFGLGTNFLAPGGEDQWVFFYITGGAALLTLLAYLLARRGHLTTATFLTIGVSLLQQSLIATKGEAALITPFFASALVLIGAACLRRQSVPAIAVLGLAGIAAQHALAPANVPAGALFNTVVAATILLVITTVVAWLAILGIERAYSLAQKAESNTQQLLLKIEKVSRMESLGRLASGVAHDFNNFLLVIRTSGELAREHAGDNPDLLEELDQIEAASQRAAALTKQLLDFSRRQLPQISRIRPGQVVLELMPLLERMVGPRVTITLDLDADESMIFASSTELEQVVINLVSNAHDAISGGGTVHLRFSERELRAGDVKELAEGRYSELVVEDNGSGIEAEALSHLFEPFFTTKERGRGTGLGLANCASITSQLGGAITVKSEPGVGTSFHVFLPLAADPARPWHRSTKPAVPVRRALVCDRDTQVCDVVRRVLGNAGCQVSCAWDFSECLQLAENEGKVELIIVDLSPSPGPRLTVLHQLHELHPDARIVLTSSSPSTFDALQQLAPGSTCRLPKPFTPAELLVACQIEPSATSSPATSGESTSLTPPLAETEREFGDPAR